MPVFVLVFIAIWNELPAATAAKPNIIVILVDDMGWSDIGCYGGEISTPAIDALATNGLRFSQFYNTGRCCPTRASLLTGLYPHQAGIGSMNEDAGPEFPGYRGFLNQHCRTLGEVLKGAGYFTAATGKWHVGAKQKEWWPCQRGFDRFFGVPQGGGFYFQVKEDRDIVLNNDILYTVNKPAPEGFYVSDAFVDYGIRFIDEARALHQPFFLYLAHIAPHWPLQAPQEDIDRYRDKYRQGWAHFRETRLTRQRGLGLIAPEWELSPIDRGDVSWGALENANKQALGMAVYAAVVERMDRSLGTLTSALRERGVLDNTVIMFLSDNGGCAEGGTYVTSNGKGKLGDENSFVRYGKAWANVSNTPFREYKHYVHEGGISSPLVVHWPQGIPKDLNGKIVDDPGHVTDIMATCVELADAKYPDSGAEPVAGRSLVPVFHGHRREQPTLYWEHEGNRAIREGDWKLVAKGADGRWELYNLKADRTELHDLASENPEQVLRLQQLWNVWAEQSHVIPHPDGRFERR